MAKKKRAKMKIYITGVAGFVGSNLADKLLADGHTVGGCDNLQFGVRSNVPDGVIFKEVGIHEIHYDINNYDILIHCATANIIYGMSEPINTWITNTVDTIELFKAFSGKIVNISTSSIYGNSAVIPTPETVAPSLTSAYARSKYASELFIQERGNYTTLRLTNVYGKNQRHNSPYSGVIGKFIGRLRAGEPIQLIGDGSQTRDFVYVDDVCEAILLAAINHPLNTEINIGTGIQTSLLEVASLCLEYFDGGIEHIQQREIDNITNRALDCSKAKELLGWKPKTSLSEGIQKLANIYSL
jgi:UDP-glucose 4-epimerase